MLTKHAPHFSEPICFDSKCQVERKGSPKSWLGILRHIATEHWQAIRMQPGLTRLPTLETQTKSKKCGYDGCELLFNSGKKFSGHLIKCHPYPLRCPYSPECNKTDPVENFAGLMELEVHIRTNHLHSHQNMMCFDRNCQQGKKFSNWNSVIDHIITEHWIDITLN